LIGAGQVATQISLDQAREARLVAEAAVDRVRDKFGPWRHRPGRRLPQRVVIPSQPDPARSADVEVSAVLFDPPGIPVDPKGLPHWPYVQAVDDALAARSIAPGTVRANHTSLERGMTMYTVMTWDVSRTGGRGGLQLHWLERKGWFYALAGLSQFDVHFYTVLTPLCTPMSAPETVADVAEQLVRFRRITETEYWELWEGAGDVQVAANDFRRARLGCRPSDASGPKDSGRARSTWRGRACS
jgi:hypothetical protein